MRELRWVLLRHRLDEMIEVEQQDEDKTGGERGKMVDGDPFLTRREIREKVKAISHSVFC